MKNLLLFILFSLCISACKQEIRGPITGCLKGKIVSFGYCSNITVELTEGNLDSNLYVKEWINPANNTVYKNVFRLMNVCSFPSNIREGEEFSFKVMTDPSDGPCAVCQAFYPTPSKGLYIEICE